MFSHSLAADLSMFDPQMPAFREAGYRILRYDMRGHGASVPPEGAERDITIHDLAEDVVQLLDHLGIGAVHWVGLSMGGMIGQVLGLDHPGRVESLCLTSTTSHIPEEMGPTWDERMANARAQGMAAIVDGTIERWFTKEGRDAGLQAIEPVRRMIANTSLEGYVACCGAVKRWRFRDRLPEIRKPALVVQGRYDPSTLVEDASHFANVEQADRWTAIVKGWVDEQANGA